MRTMTVGDLKTHFSQIIQEVQSGEEIAVSYGKKKEIVAYLVPKSYKKSTKRTLGVLADKGRVIFSEDYKMTEEEFLGL